MEKQKLREYLRDIFELEKVKLETQQIIQKLENQNYTAESYEMDSYVDIDSGKLKLDFMAFFIRGAVVGFILSIFMLASGYNGSMLLVMLICGGISVAIGAAMTSSKEENRKQNIITENEKISQKNAALAAKNKKMKIETEKKNTLTLKSCDEMKKTLANVEKNLNEIYSMDIIYPKYRNFVAVASIYEYIDSGRCSTLEGADGAYNTYELEVRLDKIITQMDVIISKLDQIMANQYYLYTAIKELQPKIDEITTAIANNTEKLDEVAVNTAITAYTTQVIEKNQYYGRSWNDGWTYDDRINMPKA